jgi:hypothetical protein
MNQVGEFVGEKRERKTQMVNIYMFPDQLKEMEKNIPCKVNFKWR